MSPEEFFRRQNMPKEEPQIQKPQLKSKPKAPRPKATSTDVEEALARLEQMHQNVKPDGTAEPTADEKIGLLANGMVFSFAMLEMLLVGLLVLVGVLYPYPLNAVIIVMAVGMAILVFYNMRKFKR